MLIQSNKLEVFMRQFYLYKNNSGYFNAVFVDPVSGLKGTSKSTHTKDRYEAVMIERHGFITEYLTLVVTHVHSRILPHPLHLLI